MASEPRVYVIAEAGVNHNGSLELALQLVDAAAKAGADAVKFQTFRASQLVSRVAEKAAYQRKTSDAQESQLAMLQRLELNDEAHFTLLQRCKERGIDFLSTPFETDSLRFLIDRIGLERLKLSSGDLTNAPLLLAAARAGRQLIVSTGMATLGEVETALGVLAFGYTAPAESQPTLAEFARAFASSDARQALEANVVLLHCTSEYPAAPNEINLRNMDTLRTAFGLPVGFSDHSEGIAIPVAAVARGAVLIEKHFTLDRTMPGPDHLASLEPAALAQMVKAIREVEQALGRPVKYPTPVELDNMRVSRKSLVALKEIRHGEILTAENLGVKRPGYGLAPIHLWEWLGRQAPRGFQVDEVFLP
jgi:N-acetylneuraminate synthase